MSYQADKPFGRRRTDKPLSVDEQRHLNRIRRDVDQDSSGLIRRYLRLSQKLLDADNDVDVPACSATLYQKIARHRAA